MTYKNPHDERSVTIGQLKDIAAGLVSGGDPVPSSGLYDGTNEYLRGMSELIGRALLDLCHVGDLTSENASLVALDIARIANDGA